MESIQWKNRTAAKEYFEIRKIFGKHSAISREQDGMAIWTRKDLKNVNMFGTNSCCFHEHIIRDESILHMCPARHTDFEYTYVKVGVHPKQIPMLFSISGSVSYDPLKNLLSARCASLGANISTLKLATDLLLDNKVEYKKGEHTLYKNKDIKYHNLESAHNSGAYKALIMSTADKDFEKKLYIDLCDNVKRLSSLKLNNGFWKAAFSYNETSGECFPPDKANKVIGGKKNKPNKIVSRKKNKPNKVIGGARKRNKPVKRKSKSKGKKRKKRAKSESKSKKRKQRAKSKRKRKSKSKSKKRRRRKK